MKILIVSDTHGRHQALDRALEEAGKIDMFIHLGDVEGGEDYLEAVVELSLIHISEPTRPY